ncbi:HEAT repeat domain-containing protein [soil metagenome]
MNLESALAQPNASARLKAALDAGTRPDPSFVPPLVARCGVEPDLNVREMLTWALVRHGADATLPLLIAELDSDLTQARSQALHTLSKIGDQRAWPSITAELLFDADDIVARTAWRAAVAVVPDAERQKLAATLATLLGRGDRDAKDSLSRALVALSLESAATLRVASNADQREVRVHAIATERLIDDSDEGLDGGFDAAMYEAERLDPPRPA